MLATRRQRSKYFRSQRHLQRHLLESLESRLLLAAFNVGDTGNPTTNGQNLQTAINNATSGDVIVLVAGASYMGWFQLTPKNFPVGSAPITIQSDKIDQLPEGQRVSPDQAHLMPKILTNSSPAGNAIRAQPGSHDYVLLGLEVTAGPVNDFNSLITIGVLGSDQTTIAQVPRNFVIDRCYVHGKPGVDQKNAISLNGQNITVKNCHISEIHSTIQDATGISGSNGLGDYFILNNYIEASTENILFGGANPTLRGVELNKNIWVEGNLFSKPMAWNPYHLDYVPANNGSNYWVKNLFELKNASNVTIINNIFENNWAGADQWGFAIVFTPRTEGGAYPDARVTNVLFENNIIQHAGGVFQILGGDSPANNLATANITIQNNIFLDIGGPLYGAKGGQGFQITAGTRTIQNLIVDHNIFFGTYRFIWTGANTVNNFKFTNNIVYNGIQGVAGSGFAQGSASINACFSNSTFTNNLIIGGNPASFSAAGTNGNTIANNYFPASIDAIGFIDFAGQNLGLLASSIYSGRGTSGSNPGVNMATLAPEWTAATAGTIAHWKAPDSTTISNLASVTDLSITAFIKPTANFGNTSTILSKGTDAFAMRIQPDGFLQVIIAGITLTDTTFNYYAAANANKNYLVGATFDAATGTVTIYRNGTATVTGSNTRSIANTNTPLQISTASFLGTITDVRILNRPITPAQMTELYDNYAPRINYIGFNGQEGVSNAPFTSNRFTLNTFGISHEAESQLTYSWSVVRQPVGVRVPTFSASGTNAAKNTNVTVYGNGIYVFACTVTDSSGLSTTFTTAPRNVVQRQPNGSTLTNHIPITISGISTTSAAKPAPVVTITSPTISSRSNTARPTITGTAGTTTGDATNVTIRIYAGNNATGTPVQTLTAPVAANGTYSITLTNALNQGTYTIQTSQSDTTNTGTSTPVTFTIDSIAPTVTGVYVRSTAWAPEFMTNIELCDKGSATFGYLLSADTTQLETLPWTNINQVTIAFSESVNITQNLLEIPGYTILAFTTDGTTATWTLDRNIHNDTLHLNLSGSVNDNFNNPLNGDGSNFQHQFRTLSGDANGSGDVDLADLTILARNWKATTTTWTAALADFDGSGFIDLADLTILARNWKASAIDWNTVMATLGSTDYTDMTDLVTPTSITTSTSDGQGIVSTDLRYPLVPVLPPHIDPVAPIGPIAPNFPYVPNVTNLPYLIRYVPTHPSTHFHGDNSDPRSVQILRQSPQPHLRIIGVPDAPMMACGPSRLNLFTGC